MLAPSMKLQRTVPQIIKSLHDVQIMLKKTLVPSVKYKELRSMRLGVGYAISSAEQMSYTNLICLCTCYGFPLQQKVYNLFRSSFTQIQSAIAVGMWTENGR